MRRRGIKFLSLVGSAAEEFIVMGMASNTSASHGARCAELARGSPAIDYPRTESGYRQEWCPRRDSRRPI